MSEYRVLVDRDEWLWLAGVVDFAEARVAGPTVRLSGSESTGSGTWTVLGADGTVVTVPSACRDVGPTDLDVSILLVQQAGLMAVDADRCDLVLRGDGVQRLEASSGARFVIDEVSPLELPAIENTESVASAEVCAGELGTAVSAVLQVVVPEVEGWPPPSVTLAVDEGRVRFSADWRPYGAPRITTGCPAGVAEPSGPAACALVVLFNLLCRTPDEARVSVVVGDESVVFTCTDSRRGWTAVCPLRLMGAWRWAPRFIGALEGSGHYAGEIEPGLLGDLGKTGVGPEVQIAFHEMLPEVARLTLVHEGAVGHGDRLLREVNELNAKKTELRFWVDRGSLVACYDLPCHRFAEVAEWADRLREETAGIDILWREAG